MNTAWEQLEGAALSLARSGPIKDRLADAYRNHLALVNPDELPDALREEFRACHDALTHRRPLRGEDAVRATVRKMSNREADDVAGSVVRLFAALAREETALAMAEVLDAALTNGSAGALTNGSAGALTNGSAGALTNGSAGALANGSAGARVKPRKGVPLVISLYAAEAQGLQSSLNSIVSQRVVSS
jgi:hypothetical protein